MANTRFRSETGLYVTGDSNTEIETVSYFKDNVNISADLAVDTAVLTSSDLIVSGTSDFQSSLKVVAADPVSASSEIFTITSGVANSSYNFVDGTTVWTIDIDPVASSGSAPVPPLKIGNRISNSTYDWIIVYVIDANTCNVRDIGGLNNNPFGSPGAITHYDRTEAIRLESTGGLTESYLSVDKYGTLVSGDMDLVTGDLYINGNFRVEGEQIIIGDLVYTGPINARNADLVLGLANTSGEFDEQYHPWQLNSDNIFVGANTDFDTTTLGQSGPVGNEKGIFTVKPGNPIGTENYRWNIIAQDIEANSSIVPDANNRSLGISTERWAISATTIDADSAINFSNTVGTAFSIAGNTAFDTDTLFIDVTNDRIGVNTVPGAYALDVAGEIHIANLHIDDTDIITNLNADKLDGQHGSSYLRSDTADIKDTGDLIFNDNIHLYLGSGYDLDIYHSGSDSYIEEQGTGNLYIQSTGGAIVVRTNTTENAIECVENGAVTLYYDASAKLSTVASGISVTGRMSSTIDTESPKFISTIAGDFATGDAPFVVASSKLVTNLNADYLDDLNSTQFLRSDVAATKTSGDLTLNDNIDLNVGSGNDLKIYHTGTDSYISHQNNVAGNDLVIRSIQDVVIQSGNGTTGYESAIEAINNGAVTLFHSGSSKLATASDGIDVTGDVGATTFTGSGANLTNLNGSQISSGTVAAARLPSVNIGTTSVPLSRSSGALTLNNIYLGTGSQVYAGATSDANAYKVPFLNTITTTAGSFELYKDAGGEFTYNPSTDTLAVPNISASTITGDGSGLTALNGSNISTGTVAAARLPSVNIGTTSVPLSRSSGALTLNNIYLGAGSQVYADTSGANINYKVPFLNTTLTAGGSTDVLKDSGGEFTYNPSTNTLTVPTIDVTTIGTSATIDNGQYSTLTIYSDDNGESALRVVGRSSQGTGWIEVGQSLSYGGGLVYEGDSTPEFGSNIPSDNIVFYRNNNGTKTSVFHYSYQNDNVYYTGSLFPAIDNTGAIGNSTYTWNNGQFTNLTIDSVISVRGAVDLADSDQIQLGSSDDMLIYHNAIDSIIDNTTGNLVIVNRGTTGGRDLYLRADHLGDVLIQSGNGSAAGTVNSIICYQSGGVYLYYNNAEKLRTSTDGVIVSGTVQASVFYSSGSTSNNINVTPGGSAYGIYSDGRNTNQYGIRADAGSGSGGVIGYTNNLAYYGILGHVNGYSFYGNGPIYTSSKAIGGNGVNGGWNAYGTRYVSTSGPSGGVDGDIWYQY